MSVPLDPIDMSQYALNSSGVVTLDHAKQQQPSSASQATEKAHIRVFNDCGSHLQVWMDTGDLREYLPAGGWLTWAIDQTANEFHWTVINVTPNPPVNLMLITYYRQGETVPEVPTLGNSPIGGAVATSGGGSTADHLINVGNPATTSPIIEIAPTGASNYTFLTDNEGNLFLGVFSAGTLTQILKIIAGAPPANDSIQIGDAAHLTHVLSELDVDKLTRGYQFSSPPGGVVGTPNEIRYDAANNLGTGGTGFRAVGGSSDNNIRGFYLQAFSGAQNILGCDMYAPAGVLGTNVAFNVSGGNWSIGVDATSLATGGQVPFKWATGNIGNNSLLTQTGANDTQILAAGINTLAGTTGQLDLSQYFRGNVKHVVAVADNPAVGFLPNTGADTRIALPIPFTRSCYIWVGDMSAWQASLQTVAGTDLTIRVFTGFASAGAIGASATTTLMRSGGTYESLSQTINYLNFKSGGSGAAMGPIIMIGS